MGSRRKVRKSQRRLILERRSKIQAPEVPATAGGFAMRGLAKQLAQQAQVSRPSPTRPLAIAAQCGKRLRTVMPVNPVILTVKVRLPGFNAGSQASAGWSGQEAFNLVTFDM